MARRLQIRKGTADEHTNFTGANGELTYDETNNRIRFHDGVTVGGIPLAKVSDSGLPLGVPVWHNGTENQIPVAHVPYNGQLLSRTTYPAMWAKVQSTFQKITDAEWLADPKKRGYYSTGDGSTTFRMPDLNGVQTNSIKAPVLRGHGGGTVAGEAKTIGQMDTDAIREIEGNLLGVNTNVAGVITGAFSKTTTTTDWVTGKDGTIVAVQQNFKASRVVPTAPENRMNSAYGIWICRVGDATTEIAEPTKHAVLTGGNTFNGSQKVVGNLEVSGTFTANIKPLLNATGDAPISACRAWVVYDNSVTPPTIIESFNISSLEASGAGITILNFTKPMPKDEYVISGTGQYSTSGAVNAPIVGLARVANPTSKDRAVICTVTDAGVAYNCRRVYVGVFC